MSWQRRPEPHRRTKADRSVRQSRPRLEWLEDRRLLSADAQSLGIADADVKALIGASEKAGNLAASVDRGDGYVADGAWVSLLRRTDKIAILVGDAEAGRGALGGLATDRTLDNGVQVVDMGVAPGADVDAAIADLSGRAGVRWAAPVFYFAESDTEMVLADEVIVALDARTSPANFFAGRPEVASYRPLAGTPDQFVAVINVGAGVPTLQAAQALGHAKGVAWTSPNFYQDLKKFFTPNDPLFSRQWHLNNTGQTGGLAGASVNAPAAWDISPGGSASVVVAVVDDGMEYTHPDLAPNLFVNAGEVPGNGVDDDGNGWVDDVNGWDFTSGGGGDNDPGPSTADDAHATSVGGVAAGAGNNALGSTGMAYKSKLLPVRIFLGGTATSTANIASAIYYAAGRTANGLGTWTAGSVMNNSWGGGSADTAITNAFAWATTMGRGGKGVVTFISSGNGGTGTVAYPSNLSSTNPGIISVGSVDATDRWGYSQYGTGLDVMASSDGNQINGAPFYMDGIVTADRQGGNGYNGAAGVAGNYTSTAESGFGGTSSASPLTAGIGALMLAVDGNLTAAQVKLLLRSTTDLVGGATYLTGTTPWNNQYGYGRVNAYSALKAIGAKAIGVQTDKAAVASGTGSVAFSAPIGSTQDRRIFIRNEGTQAINFGAPTLGAGSGFTIVTPLPVGTLALGQSTSFVVRYTPTSTATTTQTVSFTTDVAGLPAFSFTLSGAGATSTQVSGRAYHDIDNSGTFTASDAVLAGVPVFVDANGNGVFDQTMTSFASVQVPRTLSLGGFVGSGVVVSGLTGVLADLNVTVNVNQAGAAGLYLYLTSPSGVRVPLASQTTGTGASFTSTVFDDQAATAVGSGASPFTGSFRPLTPLSTFTGIDPNGEWNLQAAARTGSTATTITGWSVQTSTTTEKFTLTDASGNYSLSQLPTGANNIRVGAGGGLVATNPSPPLRVVNLPANNTTVAGADFGFQLANAVYGYVFHDRNANASRQAGEETLSGFTVFNDVNNNGTLDTGTVVPSTDVPKALPDNSTVNSVTNVAGLVGNISDVNVTVNMTHTWVGDVTLALVSPGGSVVTLVANRGGSGDNFANTVFDDQAATSIVAGAAPFTGSFRPESPLSVLNGTSPNGTWTLRMTDSATGDTGNLTGWSLTINTGVVEVAIANLGSGYYFVPNVAAGPYNIRILPRPGWTVTGPPGGVNSGTMVANAAVNGAAFGAIQQNAIYGRAFLDANANGVDNTEAGVAGRLVYLDLNNNGVRDSGTLTTVPSTNVPVAIPDNSTVNSTTVVAGLSGNIADLNVTVNITHTWTADVTLALVSPGGTVITLVARRGGSGDNFANTVFDDQAATSIVAGAAPFTGSFRPESPLSVLNGTSPNGTWTLRMTDSAGGDTGTLTGWSLSFVTGLVEPSSTTNADGQYFFPNLAPATYAVRQDPGTAPTGYRWTTPSSHSVPVAAGGTGFDKNFGQAAARVAGFTIDTGTAQRSMVRSLTMLVDGRINVLPGSAFTLTRIAGGPTLNFSVVVGSFTYVGDNSTEVRLTFAGAGLAGGAQMSLPDGLYQLALDGDAVINGGVALDGNADGAAGGVATAVFHRFFGDSNGDGVVDGTDFVAFRTAYNSGNATLWTIFDANGDGVFSAEDLVAFNDNFRRRRIF